MTLFGQIRNGVTELDNAVPLPQGAAVVVNVMPDATDSDSELAGIFLRHAGKGQGLPDDLAENHDRYAHGKPQP